MPLSSSPFKKLPALWRERFEALGRMASDRNLSLCLVGGSVRDLILGHTPLDWDVVGEGDVSPVVVEAAKKFSAGIVEHPAFLTYTLYFQDGTSLDVATARKEIYEKPAVLPTVRPSKLDEDFHRRDFTINAMAVPITPDCWGELVDPLNGLRDLEKRTVRVLHDKSFQDDPTRIYRAARYAGRYGYKVEPKTMKLIKAAVKANLSSRLTPARRRNELENLLRETDARPAMKLLADWGLWPSWEKKWKLDRFIEKALSLLKTEDPVAFRLMALCHAQPADAARKSLGGLSFPKVLSDTVTLALESLAALKKRRLPKGPHKKLPPAAAEFLEFAGVPRPLLTRWSKVEPVISGADLKQWGYAPGPLYQKILEALRQARWRGRVASFDDEKRFVFDNFPRKK